MLPNILAATLIMIGAWLLSRLTGRVARRLLQRTSSHKALNDLICRLVRFVVIIVGGIIALQVLELEKAATTFLAGAGIVGLALGFAFQDLTANFIAGVVLAVRRPMRVGDLVETNSLFGRVEKIHLRTTSIRQPDGKLVMLPNRRIFEEPLINYSDQGSLRLEVECGVSYSEDLEQVRDLVLEVVGGIDRDHGHDPEVYFTGFGNSSIDFMVRFWVPYHGQKDIHRARSAAIIGIKKAFDDRGITIPFPIRTLNFEVPGGASLSEELTQWGGSARDAA
jgi:small-conductance mechanosensitive channel